jgi:mannonate dehydratase
VVRIDTPDGGLYGLGCATFNQRSAAVVAAVEQHLRPFLIGRGTLTWRSAVPAGTIEG